ncbi:hypothetical protein NEDG_00997 [Nematocida displodere]|uniref:Uncharacterized protein n=1 Tax=Nematocida displodere TaxID=1805483 RepID=A0A177EAP3_9MICR|nr:hypothetical protein NEDG_00997 [Nematocida displodere]
MGERYKEGMPLTTALAVEGKILVGGGGGNPLFGFPNKLSLLTPRLELLHEVIVKSVVVSAKAYQNQVIVSYEDSSELFTIHKNTIQGPVHFPEGASSPIILDNQIHFVAKEGIYECSVEAFLDNPDFPYPLTEKKTTDKVISILGINNQLGEIVTKENEYLLSQKGEQSLLDGEICDYTSERSLGYIVQLPKSTRSVVTMTSHGKTHRVIESKCIVIHCLSNQSFLVGNGDGYIINYSRGKELWRSKVFSTPVSSITSIGKTVICTSINGRVSVISTSSAKVFIKVGAAIGAIGAAALLRHWGMAAAKGLFHRAVDAAFGA